MPSPRDRRHLVVNGDRYIVTIRAVPQSLNLPHSLCVTIRADYGHRSVCLIRGLTNLEYWYHSPDFEHAQTISVTPKVITKMIGMALKDGWTPRTSRTNFELTLDNASLKSLMLPD